MKPAPFAYCRPATLDEALDALARLGPDARVLAGGQSLVPALNMRLAQPSALVDINRVPGLDGIRLAPEGLVIGALARQEAVLRSPLVARHAPLIAQAMPHVAHLALRTRGTLGGSLALGDPAAELPACAVALDAVIRVARRGGEREVPAARFFRGIYATALEPGEILTAAVVPLRDASWRFHFGELALSAGYRVLQVVVIGPSPLALGTWQLLLFVSILFHHSNLRLPVRIERALVRLLVTPRMHGIHHSLYLNESNANWSSLLSVWDRLHRTLVLNVAQDQVPIGVPTCRDPRDVTVGRMLVRPFEPHPEDHGPPGRIERAHERETLTTLAP